jgi:hypothetical protein
MFMRSLLPVLLLLLVGCTAAVEKPKKLIEKDIMIDILYDIALLEAIKTQNISGGISTQKSNAFLFKKYAIDSLQWEENNKYYAADIEEYKKMFQEVKKRIDLEMQKTGAATNEGTIPTNSDVQMVK